MNTRSDQKLTEQQVIEIRTSFFETHRALAQKYNVSRRAIQFVRRGETYKTAGQK